LPLRCVTLGNCDTEEPVKHGMIAALIAGSGIALFSLPASSESGTLHMTKECSKYTGKAGDFCTIASSNFDAIPASSKVVYIEAVTATGGLDTDIVINTPNGDAAYGHVVLDGKTETGTVTLKGGTGKLAKLAGDLKVAPLDIPNYSWDGPYSY
jgi:hypothetical protein